MNWFDFNFNGFLAIFIILNVVNVILQTVKAIATVKCGKWGAAIMNAIAYALYTIVVVYMNADGLGIIWKAFIIGIANLIGVYTVKYCEERKRKDKLWKVEATIHTNQAINLSITLLNAQIPFNSVNCIGNKDTIFNIYCKTQKQSHAVREILKTFEARYFVSESKIL